MSLIFKPCQTWFCVCSRTFSVISDLLLDHHFMYYVKYSPNDPLFFMSEDRQLSLYHYLNHTDIIQSFFSFPYNFPISPCNSFCQYILCHHRTFISTGSCPYNDRCVFLHDPRVLSNRVVMKARLRKSKEDLCQDSLFWPTMPRREVVGRLDCRNCKY